MHDLKDVFPVPENLIVKEPFPGVRMTIMHAENMTLSIVEMEPHSVIPEHTHPHEQIGTMLSGEALFIVDGTERLVKAGECWRLPGNVPHEVRTKGQPMRAIDVFSPVREDMKA
ncbi:cupin domain-containing protein [Thermostilla marina]